MISIVICSRNSELSKEFYQNIDKTIGCEYELIVIDNSRNTYSIYEAYNLGIKKSLGSFLCFIHDDILFHSDNWGTKIENIFNENSEIGLIGVAGAKVKSKTPSGWWNCLENQKVINIIQHNDNHNVEKIIKGFDNQLFSEVVIIDGVFMAARKINTIFFSSKINGFHLYDFNLSMEYLSNNFKIVVTNEILIEHFSIGKINKDWFEALVKLHDIYKYLLPAKINNITEKFNFEEIEKKNQEKIMVPLLKNKYNKEAFNIWKSYFLKNPFSKLNYTILVFIIKKKLKKINE